MKTENNSSKALRIFLWVAQVTLSLGFIWAGATKLFQSPQALDEMWPWTSENLALVKITGILDLLAGVGLILPALLHIVPKITIYAAYGTIALMIAASMFHIARGEADQIGINILFGILAIFIAWGRTRKWLS